MGRKLYVGNLADEVYAETLDELFSQYGSVDTIRIITDQETGRSKGYGFVEMSSEPEGAAAIEALNGTECKGRVIKVSEAKPSKSRRRPQHSGNSSRGAGRGYGGGRGGADGGRGRGNGGGGRGRGNGGGGRGRGGAGGGRGRGGGGRGRGSSGGGRGRGGGGGGRR